jgi:cobalt-zinc-cadmium efflux system membrane fusion protein
MRNRTASVLGAVLLLLAVCAVSPVRGLTPGEPGAVASPGPGATAAEGTEFEPLHPEKYPKVEVVRQTVAHQMVTNGVVAWDVSRSVPVNSITGGRVAQVKVRLGDDVKFHQLLCILDSPELAGALAEYRKATASEGLAEKFHGRAKLLYEHEAGPLKEVQSSQAELEKAKVDVGAARERIRLYGGKVDQISPLVEVYSPIAGTIVEQRVHRGAAVRSLDNAGNLFTIADLSIVWILSDLYELNLSDVNVGDAAVVTLNAYPHQELDARVTQVARVLDPNTRTAKVRLEVPNPDGILRPGMYARVRFTSSAPTQVTAVPDKSILRLHDRYWVFVESAKGKFRRVEVEAGLWLPDGMREVRAGLREHQYVVKDADAFANESEFKDNR